MTSETIRLWIEQNPTSAPWIVAGIFLVISLVTFIVARLLIARSLVYLASRTKTKADDILVHKLRPFRFAWIAPLLVIYFFAGLLPESAQVIQNFSLLLIVWLVMITFAAVLDAINIIYEASRLYRGVSIQVYLDLFKILLIIVAILISISLVTGQPVTVLLAGLGAVMAVLLIIFHDTLLSFVASLQIQSNDMLKEGDWIEVPAYDADGDVVNITLHTIKIRNWDKTTTMIPTYKLMETPYKNWRGMQESGGRRIKRAIHLDLNSVKICDREMIERFRQIHLIQDYMDARMAEIEQWHEQWSLQPGDPFGGRQLTNVGVFRAYVFSYLKSRPDLHVKDMDLLVRQLAPGASGLPVEVYVFTKTTAWTEFEEIQADIFDHLLAITPEFGLRVFQQPTGSDFAAVLSGC